MTALEYITTLILGLLVGKGLAGAQWHTRHKKAKNEVPEGFVHKKFVEDPEHFDEQGRYKFWGD